MVLQLSPQKENKRDDRRLAWQSGLCVHSNKTAQSYANEDKPKVIKELD
jgi:hypothetical protein